MKNILTYRGFFAVALFAFVFIFSASSAHAQYGSYLQGASYLGAPTQGYANTQTPCYPSYYNNYNCGNYGNGNLSITGVNGPNSLTVGQQGTWSVTTNAPSNTYVSVTVDWGDAMPYPMPMAANAAYQVTQNNTFSHTYARAGTYTINFTASDSYGRTNSSTATVQVSGGTIGGCGQDYTGFSVYYYCPPPCPVYMSNSYQASNTYYCPPPQPPQPISCNYWDWNCNYNPYQYQPYQYDYQNYYNYQGTPGYISGPSYLY